MAEQRGGLARMRDAASAARPCGRSCDLRPRCARRGSSRSRTAAQTAAATVSGGDRHRSARSARAPRRRSADRRRAACDESRWSRPRTGPARRAPRAGRGAARPISTGTSRMMVRSGLRSPIVTRSIAFSIARLDRADPALIGPGRIRKAVAQHPDRPAASAGSITAAHVIVARGGEQQRLGLGAAEQLAHAGQQQMPDDLGAGRAARLAGDQRAQLRPPPAAAPAA